MTLAKDWEGVREGASGGRGPELVGHHENSLSRLDKNPV